KIFSRLVQKLRENLKRCGHASCLENLSSAPKVLSFRRPYFNFTNSNTKMDHTPAVSGNCASDAFCSGPPRGRKKVRRNIATAVSMPNTSLPFEFIGCVLSHGRPGSLLSRVGCTAVEVYRFASLSLLPLRTSVPAKCRQARNRESE